MRAMARPQIPPPIATTCTRADPRAPVEPPVSHPTQAPTAALMGAPTNFPTAVSEEEVSATTRPLLAWASQPPCRAERGNKNGPAAHADCGSGWPAEI